MGPLCIKHFILCYSLQLPRSIRLHMKILKLSSLGWTKWEVKFRSQASSERCPSPKDTCVPDTSGLDYDLWVFDVTKILTSQLPSFWHNMALCSICTGINWSSLEECHIVTTPNSNSSTHQSLLLKKTNIHLIRKWTLCHGWIVAPSAINKKLLHLTGTVFVYPCPVLPSAHTCPLEYQVSPFSFCFSFIKWVICFTSHCCSFSTTLWFWEEVILSKERRCRVSD